jgi:hypothetical protein
MDEVLRAIFGAGDLAPGMIDLSGSVRPGKTFELTLTENQRKSLIECCNLPKRLLQKLREAGTGKQSITVTRNELDELNDETGRCSIEAPAVHRKRLQSIQTQVAELFADDTHESLVRHNKKKSRAKKPSPEKPTTIIYQFTITLLDTKPKIWRRIRIPDCKLNNLHLHIQAVMGWENSHLHHFDIKGERHGIPEQLDYGGDGDVNDSRKVMLSEIIPPGGKKLAFRYTYDFGDNWEHEVLFEGIVKPAPKTKYPLCLEGERAGLPENCGGTHGYEHLLEVLADPRHEEHRDMLEWVGEDFDPERFDARLATVRMVRGLRG